MTLGLWVFFLLAGRTRLLRDPGTQWHTTAGMLVLQRGEILRQDPFSFRHQGEPWIPLQWLGECLMAVLHRVGGFDAQLFAACGLLAGLFGWVYFRIVRQGLHPIFALLIVVLGIGASAYHLHVRPHLFTILFMGLTVALLVDVEAGRAPVRRMALLVPMFVLWTNLHPGVFAGIAVTAVVTAGWCAARILGKNSPLQNRNDFLVSIGVLCVLPLTVLVNPYGVELPRRCLTVLSSDVVRQLISEHQPINVAGADHIGLIGLFLCYAVVLWKTPSRDWQASWLLPALLFVMACSRIRHGPLFAVTSLIVIGEMAPLSRACAWGMDDRELGDEPRFAVSSLALILFCAAGVTAQAASWRLPLIGAGWARLSARVAPNALLKHVQQYSQQTPEGTPVFNDLNYGGFVIHQAPRLRVFIDDRCELYSDEELVSYWESLTTKPEWFEKWRQEIDFSRALVLQGSLIEQRLRQSPDWKLVECGDGACWYAAAAETGRENPHGVTKETAYPAEPE